MANKPWNWYDKTKYSLPMRDGKVDLSDVEFVCDMVILSATSKTERTPYKLETLCDLIAAHARADERERCAVLAHKIDRPNHSTIANAIRAMGDE